MNHQKILILDTKPKSTFSKILTFIKVFIKEGLIKRQWHYIFRLPSLGGSIEIPRNLVNSLQKRTDFQFDYNKYDSNSNYDMACIIKDPDALRWALQQKKSGFIKKIVTGPFISTLPTDNHNLLENNLVDRLVFLCTWHRNLFLNLYKTKNVSSFIWFAGVDTERWKPTKNLERDTVLLYKKWPNKELTDKIEDYFVRNKIKYEIINCGFYKPKDYKEILEKALCTVFISHSETQGLAIFESWSMNVPTFHWDPEFMNYYGEYFQCSSSSPYLTDQLGNRFKDYSDFEVKFPLFMDQISIYKTRPVVEENYTLEKSADLFINEIFKN